MTAGEIYDWISRTGFAGGMLFVLRELLKEKPSWMPTSFHREIVEYWKTRNAELKGDNDRLLDINEKLADTNEKQADTIEKLTVQLHDLGRLVNRPPPVERLP